MRIVGFNTNEGLRLGVVDGEEVIDLQSADKNAPSDLGEWLRRNNGDLTPIKALADRAPLIARRPLKGACLCLAGGTARQGHLPWRQLPRAPQGGAPPRQCREISDHFHAVPDLAAPAQPTHRPPVGKPDA